MAQESKIVQIRNLPVNVQDTIQLYVDLHIRNLVWGLETSMRIPIIWQVRGPIMALIEGGLYEVGD
jgi:hypothetical protein